MLSGLCCESLVSRLAGEKAMPDTQETIAHRRPFPGTRYYHNPVVRENRHPAGSGLHEL